jgi:allophanate hydrolase subunit 2
MGRRGSPSGKNAQEQDMPKTAQTRRGQLLRLKRLKPEDQALLQQYLTEWRKRLEDSREAIRETERVTEADFAVHINAKG